MIDHLIDICICYNKMGIEETITKNKGCICINYISCGGKIKGPGRSHILDKHCQFGRRLGSNLGNPNRSQECCWRRQPGTVLVYRILDGCNYGEG